ncbi:MAG: hypothetical protein ALAOOOJD_02377 [bacterium]|nr:hypothetical protein [bacterium]
MVDGIRNEAGDRVELHNARLARFVQPHVDAAQIAAIQHGESALTHFFNFRLQRFVNRRRTTENIQRRGARVQNPLRFVRVKLVDVVRQTVEVDFNDRQHPQRRAVAQQRDCELAAWQKLFHQCGLLIGAPHFLHNVFQILHVVNERVVPNALAGAFKQRLHEHRIVNVLELPVKRPRVNHRKFCRGNTMIGENLLGAGFIETNPQRQGVRTGVGKA